VFFGVASFSSVLNEPLCVFFWVASFFIGGLLNEPLCIFWVASFFIGGLLNEPLCVFWGCLSFHRRSFE
jgi:hypothetical protein